MDIKNVDNLEIQSASNGVIVTERPQRNEGSMVATLMQSRVFVFTDLKELFEHIEKHFVADSDG